MIRQPAEGRTLAELYLTAGDAYAHEVACATRLGKGRWRAASFRYVADQAQRMAAALIERGVEPGDRIGLFADHGETWFIVHAAIVCAGAVVVPRGSDITVDDCRHICEQTACRIVCVADARVAGRVREAGLVEATIVRLDLRDDSTSPDGAGASNETLGRSVAVADMLRAVPLSDAAEMVGKRVAGCGADDVAVIFTSATTGVPKGVQLTHANLMAQLGQIGSIALPVGP